MKSSKKFFVLGVITLLISIVLVGNQLSKNLKIEDALTDEFFRSDTNLSIEEINNITFTEIHISEKRQTEIKELFKELKLKRTDDSYSPLDARYTIVSTSNPNDQMYIFVDENVIVFPHKSSTGYSIKNNDEFIKEIEKLLK
ncbi:hypothetical protein KD050_05140 [Psychrobacillus sp. INOP01]|uniref:hypothetical protein n=1 Tax=Psychrobacillus sp. INOP01 TaxID=2829187 RepID=UPI001BA6E79A|nr:hypothetical protein [Psychrobacillus sp. INOP01]QUG42659.1 hypothetical protein KD050_05140 [Psychrobacillus sp. INOP01]